MSHVIMMWGTLRNTLVAGNTVGMLLQCILELGIVQAMDQEDIIHYYAKLFMCNNVAVSESNSP